MADEKLNSWETYLNKWSSPLTPTEAKKVADNQGLIGDVIQKTFIATIKGETTYRDLFQAGQFGLMEAARRWEPARGAFSTCAEMWIKNKIRRYLREKVGAIRIPKWVYYGKEASPINGARITQEKIRVKQVVSMAPIDETFDALRIGPDSPVASRRKIIRIIYGVGRGLEDVSIARVVLIKTFGLDGGTPSETGFSGERFAEIAGSVGVSVMRARMAAERLILALRERLEGNGESDGAEEA